MNETKNNIDIIMPIKIDLIMSDTDHYDNHDNHDISVTSKIIGGGLPEHDIEDLNNNRYKYLLSHPNNKQINFIYDTVKNKQITSKSTYLGKGSHFAVFAIKNIYDDKHLILKVYDNVEWNMEDFVNQHIDNKKLFKHFIPDILYYGNIGRLTKNGNMTNFDKIDSYIISATYNTNLNLLSFDNKKNVLNSLITSLILCKSYNYYVYDLKYVNIGYDDKYNCVIIDYDANTIIQYLKHNGKYINDFDLYGGTFTPYYAMIVYILKHHKYITKQNVLQEKHDKLCVIGLAEIIIYLFFGFYIGDLTNKTLLNSKQHNRLISYVYPIYVLTSGKNIINKNTGKIIELKQIKLDRACVKDHGCVNFFNTIQNTYSSELMFEFVEALVPNEIDDNLNYYNMLKKILFDKETNTGLLHQCYYNIPTFENMLDKLK